MFEVCIDVKFTFKPHMHFLTKENYRVVGVKYTEATMLYIHINFL